MTQFETRVEAPKFMCAEERPGPASIVIFGASGDLTHRKIFPALFNLYKRDLLPEQFCAVGVARTEKSSDVFRQEAVFAIREAVKDASPDQIADFAKCFDYISGDYSDVGVYKALGKRLSEMASKSMMPITHVFYMATPPKIFPIIVGMLGQTGMASACLDKPNCARVVIEKPFGYDLASARELDRELRKSFKERQIYRIDHYMGKETVQNMMVFRFANAIFEPVWNRRYIDHVQITQAESEGIGRRASYYEGAGLMRDVFQNHMLQLLAMVAMEPPASFEADTERDERVKILRTIRPFAKDCCSVVRGQYGRGKIDGSEVVSYREEQGVRPNSLTETFVASEFWIDNWRWQGVPFYLRAGKRLARRISEIAIAFKGVPHSMFAPLLPKDLKPNNLIFNVQPEEGISLSIQAKSPGPKLCMSTLTMDFRYKEAFDVDLPDAYERLLLDCMNGDQSLFIRSDALKVAWEIVDPIRAAWEQGDMFPICSYDAGSWGPKEADELLARNGRKWRAF